MNLRARLQDLAAALPPHGSVVLTRDDLVALLERDARAEPAPPALAAPESWRTLVWTVPAETRIGVRELCEAVGRGPDWCYRHTSPRAADRIPHRKLDGELVFVVGELRTWLQEREQVVQDAPPRRSLRAVGPG